MFHRADGLVIFTFLPGSQSVTPLLVSKNTGPPKELEFRLSSFQCSDLLSIAEPIQGIPRISVRRFTGAPIVGCPDCWKTGPERDSFAQMKTAHLAKKGPSPIIKATLIRLGLVLGFIAVGSPRLWANVTITSPMGGNNLSADKA